MNRRSFLAALVIGVTIPAAVTAPANDRFAALDADLADIKAEMADGMFDGADRIEIRGLRSGVKFLLVQNKGQLSLLPGRCVRFKMWTCKFGLPNGVVV